MASNSQHTTIEQVESQQIMRLGFAFLLLTIFSAASLLSHPAVAESKKDSSVSVGEKDTSSTEQGYSQSKEALAPAQKPLVPASPVTRSPFAGNRQPAIAPIELDIVRTQDGKLQIRSVNPQSKFAARVKQSQVFDNWDDIWDAIGERPDGDTAAEVTEEVQSPSTSETPHSK